METGTMIPAGMPPPFKSRLVRYPLLLLIVPLMLAFPAVAVFLGWQSIAMIRAWKEAQNWVRTPATIEHLELKTHGGGDSTTCEVECRYTYVFDGRTFQGTRVGLVGGSDNIGSWQQDTYERLRRHFAGVESDPVPCWVNPRNPAEAVLDRELRRELLVFNLVCAAVFGGVTPLAMAIGAWWWFGGPRERSLRAQHPDRPWLWKSQWADGRIRPSRPGPGLWLATLLWSVTSFPVVAFVVPIARQERTPWLYLFAVFPLAGIGLLAAAVVQTRRYRRFKHSRLDLQTLPATVGGSLRGTLTLAGDLTGIADVQLTLRCIRRRVTRSGGQQRIAEEVLWEDRRAVPTGGATFGLTEIRLPVDFRIPADCRPTDESDESDTVRWQLRARADLPGADLDLKFEVPVFRTDGGSAKVSAAGQSKAAG